MAGTIRVAVAGGTGYGGVELLRLLLRHPHAAVVRATSEQYAGKRLDHVYASFRGRTDLLLEPLRAERLADGVDVAFTALPHGAAATTVVAVLDAGARVVDLSADFRLRDVETFRRWYGEHPAPDRLGDAVYGIPEFARERIRGARLVANPGCYPTGALFALVPFARAGLLGSGPIVVDAKSGASGAGRAAKTDLLFCEVEESIHPYAVGRHRHTPEIDQELSLAAGERRAVIFVPHLLPIRRGILTTAYVPLASDVDPEPLLRSAYDHERFVQLLGAETFPDVRDVRGTNHVHVGWTVLAHERMAVVVTAIDNLGRGAAAQAVQSMNVMFGVDESAGLDDIAAVP